MQRRSGQALVEYAGLLVLIAVALVLVLLALGVAVQGSFSRASASVQSSVDAGNRAGRGVDPQPGHGGDSGGHH